MRILSLRGNEELDSEEMGEINEQTMFGSTCDNKEVIMQSTTSVSACVYFVKE